MVSVYSVFVKTWYHSVISGFHGPCLSLLQPHHLEVRYRLCFGKLGLTLLCDLQGMNQTRDQGPSISSPGVSVRLQRPSPDLSVTRVSGATASLLNASAFTLFLLHSCLQAQGLVSPFIT